jgi:hypothetical protein
LDELSTRIDQARSSSGILVAVQQAQQKTKQQPKGNFVMHFFLVTDDPTDLVARGGVAAKKGKPATSRSRAKAAQCKFFPL